MARVRQPANHYKNNILATLPAGELARIAPHLERVTFRQHDTLMEPGEKIVNAYFLEDGIASVVTHLDDGNTVEVGLTGREGMVGLPALMGAESTPFHCFIQVPGSGFRISAKVVAEEFQRSPKLRRRLLQFFQAQLVQTAQTAACNRRHEVAERLARWLLSCHDRGDTNLIVLTHEFLGQMLGAPRSTVTLAAGILQQAKLIEYSRGNVKIIARKRLEEAACECYELTRKEFHRLGFF